MGQENECEAEQPNMEETRNRPEVSRRDTSCGWQTARDADTTLSVQDEGFLDVPGGLRPDPGDAQTAAVSSTVDVMPDQEGVASTRGSLQANSNGIRCDSVTEGKSRARQRSADSVTKRGEICRPFGSVVKQRSDLSRSCSADPGAREKVRWSHASHGRYLAEPTATPQLRAAHWSPGLLPRSMEPSPTASPVVVHRPSPVTSPALQYRLVRNASAGQLSAASLCPSPCSVEPSPVSSPVLLHRPLKPGRTQIAQWTQPLAPTRVRIEV